MVARTVLKEQPAMDRAAFFVGLSVHEQKRYGQARELLERSMVSNQPFPERDHAAHFLGWACYYLGDLECAKRAFSAHAAQWPNFDDTQYGLGVIALDEDRVDDAERSFARALELTTTQGGNNKASLAKALARLGDVALRKDHPEEAQLRYEEAVALWPDHYEAWSRLVRLYNREGREEDAQRAERESQAARVRMGRGEQGSEAAKPDAAAPEATPSTKPGDDPPAPPAPPVPPAPPAAKETP